MGAEAPSALLITTKKVSKMKNTVLINGVEYPCRQTMGAFVRFRQMFEKETHEADMTNSAEICGFVYCVIASACNADKVEFPYDYMGFVDAISREDFDKIVADMFSKQEEKKTENL